MSNLTALAIAVLKGAKVDEDGMIAGAEFERVGIPIMGGCQGCGAMLAAYNAYPSRTGYWLCASEIGDFGFPTLEEFERFSEIGNGQALTLLDHIEGVLRRSDIVWPKYGNTTYQQLAREIEIEVKEHNL